MFTGFSCFGLHCVPMMLQRADIRKKYNLQGDCVTDFLTSWCCACCSLIQQDKEAELREKELAEKANAAGYAKASGHGISGLENRYPGESGGSFVAA